MEKEITAPIQRKIIIDIWCLHLNEYLLGAKKIHDLNEDPHQNITFIGIQTLLHIFSILYYKLNDVDEYYRQTQRAYLLYLEYVEHVYLKNRIGIPPSLFVYNRIFENISISRESNDDGLFPQIAFWTNAILLRNVNEISFCNRHRLVEEFLHDFLLCFCQENENYKEIDIEINTNTSIDMWRNTFSTILLNRPSPIFESSFPENI